MPAQLGHQQGLPHLSLLGGWRFVLAVGSPQAQVVKILAALLAPLLQSAEILQYERHLSLHFEHSTWCTQVVRRRSGSRYGGRLERRVLIT